MRDGTCMGQVFVTFWEVRERNRSMSGALRNLVGTLFVASSELNEAQSKQKNPQRSKANVHVRLVQTFPPFFMEQTVRENSLSHSCE